MPEAVAYRIWIFRNQVRLASRAAMARSLADRMVGLLAHDHLDHGEGMILTACHSVHTCFMRFAIDVVFVDRAWKVVALRTSLPAWRVTPIVLRAQAVVELPAGTAEQAQLVVGDQLVVEPADG